MTNETSSRTSTAHVADLDDLAVGDMRMAKVGERRVVVIRTASGVHALDNACPHQGYGLVTGTLDGELVTCQWHNWKFRADTGECIMGEENVACHQVDICDGRVEVTVIEPTPDEERKRLWPSLLSGIESNYMGQVARDTARLLANDAHPYDIAWVGLHYSFPREETGPGHAMATAVDCLAWADDR
ncbi:Rieske (2Fe-2S) protein, partial [Acidimicrobiales bacterium]|nr:Rieske (2Fe-2S) protein [Acidimicrobiales bacterium]